MLVTLNGQETDIVTGSRVGDLVARLNLKGPVAAQVNDEIIHHTAIAGYSLNEGDRIEIFLMMGGG